MKKQPFFYGLCVLLLFVRLSFGQNMLSTAHDFSNADWNIHGQTCRVCHIPQDLDTVESNMPLWNRAVSSASYSIYTSSTLDATPGQPDGPSKLCLSCHDGTLAVDCFGDRSGGLYIINGQSCIGADLRDDHPISFVYNSSLASKDGGLYDPAITNSGLGGTIADDLLIDGKMQCTSCHEIHNMTGAAKLLRKPNIGSALCLTCHNK
ncbi:cytochrome c3 family protein [candidate division KSB1 bacterium]|nr:cytochrome c3 family protein [candidate division KSB1 bacterium]